MTIHQDTENCTAHLEGNESELTANESQSYDIHTAKDTKKTNKIQIDSLDPDIIPPAETSPEDEINSEFYPRVYIP